MRLMLFCLLLSVTAMVGFPGAAHSQNAPAPAQKNSTPAPGPREAADEVDYQRNLYRPSFDITLVDCQTADVGGALFALSDYNEHLITMIKVLENRKESEFLFNPIPGLASGSQDNTYIGALLRAYKDNEALRFVLSSLRRCSPEKSGDTGYRPARYAPSSICPVDQAKWNYEWAHRKAQAASNNTPAKKRWDEYEKIAKLAYEALDAHGGGQSCPPSPPAPARATNAPAAVSAATPCPLEPVDMIALKRQVDQVSEDFKRESRKTVAAYDSYAPLRQSGYETHNALIDADAAARAAKSDSDTALSKLRDGLKQFRAAQDRRAEINKTRPLTPEEESRSNAEIAGVGLAGLKDAYDAAAAKASDAVSKAELALANDSRARRSARDAYAAWQAALKDYMAATQALEDVRITLANLRDCPPPAPPASSAANAPAVPPPCPNDGGLAGNVNNVACKESR